MASGRGCNISGFDEWNLERRLLWWKRMVKMRGGYDVLSSQPVPGKDACAARDDICLSTTLSVIIRRDGATLDGIEPGFGYHILRLSYNMH